MGKVRKWFINLIGLQYEKPENFARCLWNKKGGVTPTWIAYRVIAALFVTVAFVYFSVAFITNKPDESAFKILILAMFWNNFFTVLFFDTALFISIKKFVQEKKCIKSNVAIPEMKSMPCYYKLNWIFYMTTLPSALVLSVLFWGKLKHLGDYANQYENVTVTTISSVLLTFDLILNAIPIKIAHFYFCLSYSLLYLLFTYVYYVAGGLAFGGRNYIYKILDWQDPERALLTAFLSAVFTVSMYITYVFLQEGKTKIFKKYVMRSDSSEISIDSQKVKPKKTRPKRRPTKESGTS